MKPLLYSIGLALSVAGISATALGQAQGDVYRQNTTAKVMNGSTEMGLAWCGGVNHPQMAMADLNNDGRKDIIIHEAQLYGRVKTFTAEAPGVYRYAPKYESNFPKDLNGYIKLVDYNGDKIPDLVHRGYGGANVSFGYYQNNELKFKFISELWYYHPVSKWVNAHVANGDIPEVLDVDGDGDLDLISYGVGGFTLEYYENCTPPSRINDTVKICFRDQCWGKTQQLYMRAQVLGANCNQSGTTCKGCENDPERKGTHGSNTLCFLDMDDDGDWDFFNGNQDYNDIQLLFNGKSQYGRDSIISQDTSWESNGVTMHVPIFPAAFHLDVNHNGANDLLFISTDMNTENYNSIVYYENTGSNSNKNFVHRSNNYLTDKMIDLGSGSYPVFYDYDKDGKKDLLIGSDGYYQYPGNYNKSRISYYRNTSLEEGKYSFELVTDDFLGLSAYDWKGAALAIGDLDNDTLDDLVIGRTDGTFAFFKNNAVSVAGQPVWQLTIDTLKDGRTGQMIDVGEYAAPCLYDINNDGHKDLVSGTKLGDMVYFHNYSSIKGVIGIEKKTDNLGGIKFRPYDMPYSYTTPYIGSIDDSGNDYLVVGTYWGQLYRYTGFQNGANPAKYTMTDSNYSYINVGLRAAPAFANLDNDNAGLHELVVGNHFGGLNFYKQDFKVGIKNADIINKEVTIYPNPASSELHISWDNTFNSNGVTVQLVSVTGQVVTSGEYNNSAISASLSLQNISSGMYYCIIQSGGERIIKPVSVIK